MGRLSSNQVLTSMGSPIGHGLKEQLENHFGYSVDLYPTEEGLIVCISKAYGDVRINLYSLQAFLAKQEELNNLIPNLTMIAVVIKRFDARSQLYIGLTDDIQQVIINRKPTENRERPSNYLRFDDTGNNPYYETSGGALYEKLEDGSLALLNYFDNERYGYHGFCRPVEREPIDNRTSIIMPHAFSGCRLSDLTFPESVTRLLPGSLAGLELEGTLVCKGPVTELDFTGSSIQGHGNLIVYINNSRDKLTPETEERVKLYSNTRLKFVLLAPTLSTRSLGHGMLQLSHAELKSNYCNLQSPVDFYHLTYRHDPILADASYIAYLHSINLECYDGIHEGTAIMFLGKTPLQIEPNPEFTYDKVIVWEDPKTVQELVLKAKLED